MEDSKFINLCKTKFSYLAEEFGFNDGIFEFDGKKLCITYEKPSIKLKIINHIVESPEFPIAIYIIMEEKKLLNRFFKKVQIYDLDDLLIYRKCNSQVYEYLDYNNITTFYDRITKEKLEYYKEKYSKDEEVKLIIDKYSRLLKDFSSDILKGNFDILSEVRKLRKEHDKKFYCGSVYY